MAEELGLELEIIDRETEATLAATGCTPLIDRKPTGVVLFDIGGGSSELAWLDSRAPCRRGPPLPRSTPGTRCRSASSRSPSATAAST